MFRPRAWARARLRPFAPAFAAHIALLLSVRRAVADAACGKKRMKRRRIKYDYACGGKAETKKEQLRFYDYSVSPLLILFRYILDRVCHKVQLYDQIARRLQALHLHASRFRSAPSSRPRLHCHANALSSRASLDAPAAPAGRNLVEPTGKPRSASVGPAGTMPPGLSGKRFV